MYVELHLFVSINIAINKTRKCIQNNKSKNISLIIFYVVTDVSPCCVHELPRKAGARTPVSILRLGN